MTRAGRCVARARKRPGAVALVVLALAVTAAARAADPAPQPGAQWLPRGTAALVALNKIDARATPLTVKVGQSARFGSLTIAVRACDVRPPDMVPDATAWLDIQDSHPGGPGFHGWILRDEPHLSSFEHPVYDVHLAGCS